jgi:Putative MetA-pathway of phenol degradation
MTRPSKPAMEKLLLLTALVIFDMSGLAQESSEAGQIGWLAQVARTQATQPHWITPVVTVTPRLEQEFRYDISKQTETNGTAMEVYGNGKGPEFIPIQPFQVTLGLPGYVVHHQASVSDGWGDFSLLVKYRLLARDENHGNYILTAFLGASVPTGSHNIGAGHGTFSPTLAAGKGFGEFSVQSTVAITLSTSSGEAVGRPISHNTALQYQVRSIFWPEVEVNSTFWRSGVQAGQKQVFATPGLVIGRIRLKGHLKLAFGTGFQIALTHFHTYDHRLVFTVRFPFN